MVAKSMKIKPPPIYKADQLDRLQRIFPMCREYHISKARNTRQVVLELAIKVP
jgi:hypothetical protein